MARASSLGDGDDVPPLEDLSEMIDQIKILRNEGSHVHQSLVMESSLKSDEQVKTFQTSFSKEQKSTQRGNTFGGFKKGFLNNPKVTRGKPSLSSRSLRNDNDIPVLKPKNPMEKNRGMEIPEVQEAMKSNLENKEWITDNLLKKIEASPFLAKLLMDPEFTAALSQVQADPMKAMSMLGCKPEMQKALQELSGILGEHFTTLGQSSAGVKTTIEAENTGLTESSTSRQQDPVSVSSEDEAKMHQILSDPEVMKVLQDHEIQKLLTLMKTNPDAAQLEARNAAADTKAKIKKLVDVGLLGFAP